MRRRRRDDIAEALGAKTIHMPARVMGVLVDISWRARLQPIDRGWIDMAFSVPQLDCARAREELGWRPMWSSTAAFADLIHGVCDGAHGESPPLRRRSILDPLNRDVTQQATPRETPALTALFNHHSESVAAAASSVTAERSR